MSCLSDVCSLRFSAQFNDAVAEQGGIFVFQILRRFFHLAFEPIDFLAALRGRQRFRLFLRFRRRADVDQIADVFDDRLRNDVVRFRRRSVSLIAPAIESVTWSA